MGTAILLPHDCLPNSKNRHKGHLSEAIFHSDRASRVRKGTPQATVLRDSSTVCLDHSTKYNLTGRVEWTPKSTPLPHHDATDPLQFQKDFEGRKFTERKPIEVKESKSSTKSTGDVPVFTILQRPKTKEAADELIAKFLVKVEGEKVVDGHHNSKLESSEIQNGTISKNHVRHLYVDKPKLQSSIHLKSAEMKLPRCNPKKGGCIMTAKVNLSVPKLADKVKSYISEADLNAGKGQCHNLAPCAAQPINVPRRESQRGFDNVLHLKGLSQVASLKAASEHKNLKKVGSIESLRSKHFHQTQQMILESTVPGGLSRLKRATTDPQIVKQLVGCYRSEGVDIPFSEAKSCYGFARTTYMSCPERWAGPSYYSSPAPSSLPLPKFSFPNQRMPSFQYSGEGYTRNIPESPGLESSSPEPSTSPLQGAALDVAFATKSLRRMLKLDPF